MGSFAIYNLVRGLTKPYLGAHVKYCDEDVVIWKIEEVACSQKNIEPGKVLESDGNTILVKCYDNAIRILDHEFKSLPNVGEYL